MISRILIFSLLFLLIQLQYQLWFGKGGYQDLQLLQQLQVQQTTENTLLQQRNASLAADVEDLKYGTEAIEERARSELGLVKPNEIFVPYH